MSAVVDPTAASDWLAAAEPSHYHDIHSIEHQLQNTGKHQWQCKRYQFIHDRPVAHIDLIFIIFHSVFSLTYAR